MENLVNVWMDETSPQVEANALETHEAIKEALTNHLSENIDKGDMVVARKNGEIAGMVRGHLFTYKYHPDPENEHFIDMPFIEIGKAVVLPKFRKQGIYKKINSQLIKNLSEKYPNTRMLVGTKEPSVKKIFIDEGWEEITFDRYLRIHNRPENEVQAQMEAREKAGWTAFLYNPKTLSE